MSANDPVFLLKIADALVEEVSQSTDVVLQAAQELQNRDGFIEGVRGAFSAGKLTGNLKNNLSLAIKLCESSAQLDPSIKLENGLASGAIKAKALFHFGLISIGQKSFKEAVKYFEDSINYEADQATYFNIALCLLEMKGLFRDRTQDAVGALQKCMAHLKSIVDFLMPHWLCKL